MLNAAFIGMMAGMVAAMASGKEAESRDEIGQHPIAVDFGSLESQGVDTVD